MFAHTTWVNDETCVSCIFPMVLYATCYSIRSLDPNVDLTAALHIFLCVCLHCTATCCFARSKWQWSWYCTRLLVAFPYVVTHCFPLCIVIGCFSWYLPNCMLSIA